jgi:hypothetical protein
MLTLIYIVVITCLLLAIAIEDFRFRAVHWFLFPAIFLLLSALSYHQHILSFSLKNAAVNCFFIGTQLLLTTLYFSFRKRKVVNLFESYIGLGDIAFLISISGAFPTPDFILFYISSLLLTLLIFAGFIIYKKNTVFQIPLAGTQSLIFLTLFLFPFYHTDLTLYGRSGIIHFLF